MVLKMFGSCAVSGVAVSGVMFDVRKMTTKKWKGAKSVRDFRSRD
jgi:hypothetical protein